MRFRFQSFFDVSTSKTSMQILQWSVGGSSVIERCRHLFGAYKYFKLGKISVKFVPASTLPVDPQGLSYAEDDPYTVDPRDQMNPGLVRITNGEDIFTRVQDLNDGQQEAVYNSMMLDPRWSKFMLQSGFRRSAYPLYWQVGQLSQDKFPGATINIPHLRQSADGTTNTVVGVDSLNPMSQDTTLSTTRSLENVIRPGVSSMRGLFQVGHRGKLGFLPTDYLQYYPKPGDVVGGSAVSGANNVPEVSVITCVLPKAYKTIYFYRVFITEEVIFSGLRSSPMVDSNGAQTFGVDQFLMGNITTIAPWGSMTRPAVIDDRQNNGDDQP